MDRNRLVVIISNDNDYLQLVNEKTLIWSLQNKLLNTKVEMTAEEIQNSLDFENAVLLSEQKAAARKIITDQIDAGYNVQPEDFVLGLSEYDRTAFTQMLLLVREALDLGLIANHNMQIISDKTGEKHSLTTERFRQIMISYGLFYKSLWDQLS